MSDNGNNSGIFIPPIVGPRWIEIDLDAIAYNVSEIKNLINPQTKLMAVVKADAYGCGLVGVSGTALDAGADMLGVTTVNEGMELRDGGIEAPVLLFAPLNALEISLASQYDLTVTADSINFIKALERERIGNPVNVHIKVDTGMNRLGLNLRDVLPFVRDMASVPDVTITGIYSHFATTPLWDKPFMDRQFDAFSHVITSLEEQGYHIPVKHICNSAATIAAPEMRLDMVRVGTLIYGQYPFGFEGKIKLRDPWAAKARIISVKDVPAGESIGYGRDFKTKRPTRVGLIPMGFAEGLGVGPDMKPKNPLDLIKMIIKRILAYFGIRAGIPIVMSGGKPIRILGRIGMQFTALDVTGMDGLQAGDTVTISLRRTGANSKLPRVYLRNKKIMEIRNSTGYMLKDREYF